ncbi:hypothetical protein ACFSQU_00440 [Massilia sp. GCM10020059]|uniref:Uncharacterized protein n=1 Tax=Massilia agrisoli TaxID=2892444 RepID=A0ABS8IZW5_9BURK|nr:hypothetical protein [Massilia agrisoli]MCC6073443.1 hypothetical protein [Massilia agrisoli]
MESDQNRPQADGAGPSDPGQAFAAEPDFSRFKPDVRESLLPRWLQLSLLWILGLGAAAALVMAGMFVTQQRKTDKTLELLAVSSRSMDVPVAPAVAPIVEKKPSDMVFLPAAEQVQAASAGRTNEAAGSADLAAVSASPAAPAAVARQRTSPAKAPAKASPAKAKQGAVKKKPKPRKSTALAQRGKTQTWPRRRGDSITERLNAAVAACRARPHEPGECNLRACDILGSSDPACR